MDGLITILAVVIGWLLCYAALRTTQTKQALTKSKSAFFNVIKPPKKKATIISPREQEEARERKRNELPHRPDDLEE